MFFVGWLLDVLIPDVPEEIDVKIKRQKYLEKQALLGVSPIGFNKDSRPVASCPPPAIDSQDSIAAETKPTVFNPKSRSHHYTWALIPSDYGKRLVVCKDSTKVLSIGACVLAGACPRMPSRLPLATPAVAAGRAAAHVRALLCVHIMLTICSHDQFLRSAGGSCPKLASKKENRQACTYRSKCTFACSPLNVHNCFVIVVILISKCLFQRRSLLPSPLAVKLL